MEERPSGHVDEALLGGPGEIVPIHLLDQKPRRDGNLPTRLWVFDAVADYFRIYTMTGAALRDPTISDTPSWTVSGVDRLRSKRQSGPNKVESELVRSVLVPVPVKATNGITFKRRPIDFVDGVVDMDRWNISIKKSPWKLKHVTQQGISQSEWMTMRFSSSFCLNNIYKDHHRNPFIRIFNDISSKTIADRWKLSPLPRGH